MFIAHLPAGVLVTLAAHRGAVTSRALWCWGLAGSLFPDVDLFWFYLVDGRRTLHHEYWTHLPAVWLCLAPLVLLGPALRLFWLNVVGHLVLDTMAGGILWAWPFDRGAVTLVSVPARFEFWVWNFVLHWSFLVELAILAAAVIWLAARAQERPCLPSRLRSVWRGSFR